MKRREALSLLAASPAMVQPGGRHTFGIKGDRFVLDGKPFVMMFRGEPTALDYDNIPTAIFAIPNVATVGLSEEAARKQGRRIKVANFDLR